MSKTNTLIPLSISFLISGSMLLPSVTTVFMMRGFHGPVILMAGKSQTEAAPAAFYPAFSRQFLPPIPPVKSQNSRSAPLLLIPSKILTDIFRTANSLSDCNTTIHLRAGCASMSMANHFLSCDRSSLFEQDFPRSGQRLRADHTSLTRCASGVILAPG